MAYIGRNPNVKWLNLEPQTSDPSSPNEGDVFYSDGTPRAEGIWVYKNAAWEQVSASTSIAVTTKTANYTATTSDGLILCSGSAFTVTLPTAVGITGKEFIIKKTDSSLTNIITIDGNASETIDGSITIALNTLNEAVRIVSDGSNWQILERRIPTYQTTYTPTLTGFGTISAQDANWIRRGKFLVMQGQHTNGTTAASVASVTLPSGLTIDTTYFPRGNTTAARGHICGWYGNQAAGNTGALVTATATSTSVVYFAAIVGNASNCTPANGNAIATSSSITTYEFEVPISEWST